MPRSLLAHKILKNCRKQIGMVRFPTHKKCIYKVRKYRIWEILNFSSNLRRTDLTRTDPYIKLEAGWRKRTMMKEGGKERLGFGQRRTLGSTEGGYKYFSKKWSPAYTEVSHIVIH